MTADELRAADEAVAVALGWEHLDASQGAGGIAHWHKDMPGGGHDASYECPPYVSGGDWRRWGEMIEALLAHAAEDAAEDAAEMFPGAVRVEMIRGRRHAAAWAGSGRLLGVTAHRAATLGEALYLAGAAAGLWPDVRDNA